MFTPAETQACRRLVQLALAEDLGTEGDITSATVIPSGMQGQASFVARAGGVVAGLPAAALVFEAIDSQLRFDRLVDHGRSVRKGEHLATVSGSMRSILAAERTALNFVQRLSGIATRTHQYVAAVAGLPCRVLDTRKTAPGWRLLEKYAVRCGGGHNHRQGLFDVVLIKDNHLAALAGEPLAITRAIHAARDKFNHSVPIIVEIDKLEQLDEALACRPEVVLLDNMSQDDLRTAVARRNAGAPEVRLEASGGINLSNARQTAATGVDRISVGELTHSAAALDIALDYEEAPRTNGLKKHQDLSKHRHISSPATSP
jgi:nicotinate-nucleotide pyrophosphorylase (carboxylating)